MTKKREGQRLSALRGHFRAEFFGDFMKRFLLAAAVILITAGFPAGVFAAGNIPSEIPAEQPEEETAVLEGLPDNDELFEGYFEEQFYGKKTAKPGMLKEECEKAGIGVSIRDAVTLDGHVVSSTLIREMISTGNMEMTARLLGRPYSFAGTVSHGKRLGTSMGIPTINIPAPKRQMLPPNGVYFSRIKIDGEIYASVSNLGCNPTVNGDSSVRTIETNIFDFDDDVYGRDVLVCFDHFSRGERKFRDKEELFAQIARDCRNAIEYRQAD